MRERYEAIAHRIIRHAHTQIVGSRLYYIARPLGAEHVLIARIDEHIGVAVHRGRLLKRPKHARRLELAADFRHRIETLRFNTESIDEIEIESVAQKKSDHFA